LAAGRREDALRLLRALESLAGDGGMIPEQVWDAADIPERGLFQGRPTGSAMPLVWAHAEYLKLRRSLKDGHIFDQPAQTARRYAEQQVGSNRVIWRIDHQRRVLSAGEMLRIELPAPAVVRWTRDGWRTTLENHTRDTGLDLHVVDLATDDMRTNETVEVTFYWPDADRSEAKNFRLVVI
jgi:glucoamylase